MSAELSPPPIAKRRHRTGYQRDYMRRKRALRTETRLFALFLELKQRFEPGARVVGDYVGVAVVFLARSRTAIFLTPKRSIPGTWIPRHTIHPDDERQLDRIEEDQKVMLRIHRWKAEREGLI